jgi:hypothetical protein
VDPAQKVLKITGLDNLAEIRIFLVAVSNTNKWAPDLKELEHLVLSVALIKTIISYISMQG